MCIGLKVCEHTSRAASFQCLKNEGISKGDRIEKNLFGLNQPQFFDIVVQSVKVIAKCDSQKDMFESPTFAMNISLKDCCDIAVLLIIKRKYNYMNISASEAEANIGIFRRLLENMRRQEISSLQATI